MRARSLGLPILAAATLLCQPPFADRAHVDLRIGVSGHGVQAPHRSGKHTYQPNDERQVKPHHRGADQADRRD